MRRIATTVSVGMAIVLSAPLHAQQGQATAHAFASADRAQKAQMLRQMVLHESSTDPETTVELIRAALADPEVAIRQCALAVVLSRAAGPRFSPSRAVATDCVVETFYADPSAMVRTMVVGVFADESSLRKTIESCCSTPFMTPITASAMPRAVER